VFKTFAGMALAGVVLSAPALAQTRKTEFGSDLRFQWAHSSKVGESRPRDVLASQVSLRLGIPLAPNVLVEARFTPSFNADNTVGLAALQPGLNVVVDFPGSVYNQGPYVTLGADLDVPAGFSEARESAYEFNVGVGMRSPTRAGAVRSEFFVGFRPKQNGEVNSWLAVGARLGLSFFL